MNSRELLNALSVAERLKDTTRHCYTSKGRHESVAEHSWMMSVNPGFGGQKFIVHTLDKVRELRELITNTGSQALIEVDGGVNLETGRQLVEAGADVLVAGNAVFKAPDMSDMIHRLKSL